MADCRAPRCRLMGLPLLLLCLHVLCLGDGDIRIRPLDDGQALAWSAGVVSADDPERPGNAVVALPGPYESILTLPVTPPETAMDAAVASVLALVLTSMVLTPVMSAFPAI